MNESKPVMVDTGGFYAVYDEDDEEHERADAVFRAIAEGDLAYSPVYTHRHVLSELATLLLYRDSHATAVAALDEILGSGFRVLGLDGDTFERARSSFEKYDDQTISYVDHITATVAEDHGVEHVMTFDDDFRTLGFSLVPEDTVGFGN